MRVSQFFLSTLKEAPGEAELVSHKLMLRAGLISRLGSGLYSWMPLGWRVYQKVEAVIREEMNRAGAIELKMPVVLPAELWQETGRWDLYGPLMLRIEDRQKRWYCFAPTHEEVITDIARRELKSYRQLPKNFYHISEKFRDEIRPRFGLMRAREFTMKDAYSFDRDRAGLMRSYQNMYDAYARIFSRLGLTFRPVVADTGEIGGSASHEFQVLADAGEDVIAYCPASDYAANIELAEAVAPAAGRAAPTQPMQEVPTPGKAKCEDVAALLGIPLQRTVKSVVMMVEGRVVLLLVRGDHEVNEVKLRKIPQLAGFRMATEEEIRGAFHCPPGYLGPLGKDVMVVADRTVAAMSDFVCGANRVDYHLTGLNWGRDLPEPALTADIRNVLPGDPSPDGKGELQLTRGIEVGHVFALGTKYSVDMEARFIDEDGQAKPFEMGCYGIGVSRTVAAAIEQNYDERGIIWPAPMAPFQVAIAPIGYRKSEAVRQAADRLHESLLEAGVEVLLDDRDERPGAMFADLELIGIPHRVTIGDRGLKNNAVEYQARRDTAPTAVGVDEVVAFMKKTLGRP
jgi:prolyl-tRNA synthetase